MYVETIPFEPDMPIAFDAYKASYYHLHCHEDVVEVLILLSGSARVKVSFEEFDLKEGDYIVINAEDSHSIYATDSKCEAASLYFNMAGYREHIPYLDYVLFACESFDLVKYKNETQTLRRMIANVLLHLATNQTGPQNHVFKENLIRSAEELLWIFVNEYDMKNYYSRNWNAGYHKTETYYKIMKYMLENYEIKNLMDYISKNEFYSKSYITHLFKQVGASSFQDVLTYLRLYRSERLLLDSDIPIIEIADRCGFSDIKYYTSNFKKWFLHTPSEYRKIYQPEIAKRNLFQRLRTEDIIRRMENMIKSSADDTRYKAAINPISIKTRDPWTGMPLADPETARNVSGILFSDYILSPAGPEKELSGSADSPAFHRICIGIDEKTDIRELAAGLRSFQDQGFIPVLAFNYSDLAPEQCRGILKRCSAVFSEEEPLSADLEVAVVYSNPGDKANVVNLLQNSDQFKRIRLRPVLMIENSGWF